MEEIFTILAVVIAAIIAFMFGRKSNNEKQKNKNWRVVKNKPEYIEILDEGEWRMQKLPKNEKGKQIKNNEVEEIQISNKGEMNVKIISGVTDRRNISNNS